ncbi:hypothetical protein E2C01_099467 [Portunus trituberculatus]|uniref:Uncharacterized protein n=1 Tax=Portunus trituberculatus TaxID=210409 RepID=A0A5B7K5J7_PORTR|nr:hypothetical protein [Portunus trituberculatus]
MNLAGGSDPRRPFPPFLPLPDPLYFTTPLRRARLSAACCLGPATRPRTSMKYKTLFHYAHVSA